MTPNLPIYQVKDKTLMQLQTVWKSQLTPAIQSPIIQGLQLDGVKLLVGANTINHLLQRQMQGWMIVDINGAAAIYRSQPLNDTTLTLTSNAIVTVSIWAY
jgi:hypothetical protein